jgi:hypothetical protein
MNDIKCQCGCEVFYGEMTADIWPPIHIFRCAKCEEAIHLRIVDKKDAHKFK